MNGTCFAVGLVARNDDKGMRTEAEAEWSVEGDSGISSQEKRECRYLL